MVFSDSENMLQVQEDKRSQRPHTVYAHFEARHQNASLMKMLAICRRLQPKRRKLSNKNGGCFFSRTAGF